MSDRDFLISRGWICNFDSAESFSWEPPKQYNLLYSYFTLKGALNYEKKLNYNKDFNELINE